MTSPHYQKRQILLLSFADSTGNRGGNQRPSEDRARAIERDLGAEGLKPAGVRGFGGDLPVASNDPEEGREKNRRIEVWLHQ
ncbi:MAG: OmpA family protein [Acidobacteriota bacterium]|nr:OmpA family protein [Acidobacteriota bacterium]